MHAKRERILDKQTCSCKQGFWQTTRVNWHPKAKSFGMPRQTLVANNLAVIDTSHLATTQFGPRSRCTLSAAR